MTDEELLAQTSATLGEAHRAEFAEWSLDHRGHSAIINHKDAWAFRTREFVRLYGELKQRGLKLPKCDCPPGAHAWENRRRRRR